jgi:hypothetical protein
MLFLVPEFPGRNLLLLHKNPIKVSGTFKTTTVTNISDCFIGLCQQVTCPADPDFVDIIRKSFSGGTLKEFAKGAF